MAQVTTTLKLEFFDLNKVKETLFADTVAACTALSNTLLKVPFNERQKFSFADRIEADVYVEDLTGIRHTSKQRKTARSDAGTSRNTWAYYDLEIKIAYKMALVGKKVKKRRAAYTSKTDHRTGKFDGKRDGCWFMGGDGYRCHADWNAAINIAQWDGFCCSLDLQGAACVMEAVDSENGVIDSPLNSMKTLEGVQPPLYIIPGVS